MTTTANAPLTAPGSVKFDFDGDGHADVSRWQASTGEWSVKNSGGNTVSGVVLTGTAAAPADYDGNGTTDYATFTDWSGTWKIKKNALNGYDTISPFGQAGDKPVPGDYDGDGIADLAFWRPSTGTWYVRQSTNLQVVSVQFGASTDIPVPGNYDGDSKMDFAVFRPSNGTWYVLNSSTGAMSAFQWGAGTDTPVPADYDGDGKTDFAVYRPSNGTWYVYQSYNGSIIQKTWGNYGDQPVPADYDGDGKADIAVWRPTTGVWYIVKSSDASLNTYDYNQLGMAGDTAGESAYLKQIGAQVSGFSLARARLAPQNATGGISAYSGNFSWAASLVNLPGRAGLDAGFGVSYNSLVWTKVDNTMVFDPDNSNVSPGFHFGFPVIEPSYYNQLTGQFSYLMVTPSGGRVEFRQNAASGVYETADSSYAQLTVTVPSSGRYQIPGAEDTTLTVTTTNGTQMVYSWKAGAFRLNQIKDRNGNFISVLYDDQYGLLRSVTDTLGRVVTVDYDSDFYPTAVKQQWKSGNGDGSAVTHTYATFSYTYANVSPSFGTNNNNLTVYGPNGTLIKVLNSITYAEGGMTTFEYNSFGQVWRVRNVAADSSAHELNRVRTDLQSPSTGQPDCPRFTTTYNYVENFNGLNGQPSETVIHNTLTANGTFTAGGETLGPADVVEMWMDGDPNTVHSKTYYYTAGNWAEGLPFGTEDIAGGARKRWTRTVWTQDDLTKIYQVNPRVTETKVGDDTNTKRTTVDYLLQPNTTVSVYGLPSAVKVYDTDQRTVLKQQTTSYNQSPTYLNRRIIGLPLERDLSDQNNALMSKVTYQYDEGDFTGAEQNISPTQHDNTNYGASFIAGRGNLTSITRWSADPSDPVQSVASSVKYNTAGAMVARILPDTSVNTTRQITISYQDVFNDDPNNNLNRNTFAYPTKITDPAGNFSQVKYRFDIGANVWAKSPAPQGSASGKETTRTFDSFGRPVRQSVIKDGAEYAYTRYEYPSSQNQSKVYTTVTDTNGNNIGDAADEALTESLADGAGRVYRSRTANPGSTGGYSATQTEYDPLGQIKRSTAPAEVDSNWGLAGDDATRGSWLWKSQEYDWKGRVTKTTATDGTFSEAAYDGCGCAGGEIVTVTGEQLAAGRRTQKAYSDILGRQFKTEVLNWDGSVYSSTVTKFDGRDQPVWVRQYDGAAPSFQGTTPPDSLACPLGTCQEQTMTYDGHGRLKAQHKPQQDAGRATVYSYYQNDEVRQVTDARGATTAYSYNNRGLVTGINYSMPSGSGNPPIESPSGNWATSGSPIGFLDSVDTTTWTAKGWSLDPDDPNTSNTIHFYIDKPAGQSTVIGQTVADKSRPDVNAATGQPGNHGFEFVIPNQYLDGRQHTIYAYGIDTGSDAPTLLSGSPKTFSYSPNAVQPPLNSSVAFDYDAAGNRLWMTDGLGRTDYEYDQLSRLKSETRKFVDTTQNGSQLVMANAPLPDNGFKLQYAYGLSNQLTSLTDPFGAVINYGYDSAGRLKNVTGSTFGTVTNYASNANYEAWGGLKGLTYSDNVQMQMTFNNRLQAATYNLAGGAGGQIMNKQYSYYADGSLSYAQDLIDPKFDRLNIYDQAGRIKEGKTGLEARGGTVPQSDQSTSLPYRQSYQFNAFNNLTQRTNLHWGIDTWQGQSNNLSYTYQNNRIQGAGWQYDADGRNLQTAAPDDYASSVYNAAGQMTRSTSAQTDAVRLYDGNGREVKRTTANYVQQPNSSNWVLQPIKYYVRSSVLSNEVVSEVWANGKKGKTFVRAAGAQLAYQAAYASDTAQLSEAVFFQYSDASGMSQRTTDKTGAAVATGNDGDGSPVELDPLGNNVGISTPYVDQSGGGGGGYEPSPLYPMLQPFFADQPMYVNGMQVTCTLDGMAIGCSSAFSMLGNGSAIPSNIAQYNNTMSTIGLGGTTVEVPGENGGGNACQDGVCPDRNVVTVNAPQSTIIFVPDYSIVSWNPRQTQQLAPLDPKKDAAINNALKELKDRLSQKTFSEDCKKNVLDKLATLKGFDLEKFINFLDQGGNFYDGKKSDAPYKDYALDSTVPDSIAEQFKKRDTLSAFTAVGTNISKFTVFFRPSTIETAKKESAISGVKLSGLTNDNLVFIFHEGLHGFGNSIDQLRGNYDDASLQKLFGVAVGAASINISEYIKKHCFK